MAEMRGKLDEMQKGITALQVQDAAGRRVGR
jgi:hypothetical protein